MKKTKVKKLVLAKETVRRLEEGALEEIVAGGKTGWATCDTWRFCPNEPNPY